ncbi:MAG: DM13 domain-containing protein [Sphaerospermopsis sp. SIO1G2]|nr:DM13 domain-containing protein [Sphaerospermopsis sp. SIO1G2]
MKILSLTIVILFTVLSVGCTKDVTSTSTSNQTVTENQTESATQNSTVSNSSSFQTLEHKTQGKLNVITENGTTYLQFDQSFQTDSGPDLVVVLHRGDVPSNSLQQKDYVSVARLEKIKGSQRYTVPKNLNLANFKSVGIWCRQFNVTFGYASLPASV